jgi:hypothetical protein
MKKIIVLFILCLPILVSARGLEFSAESPISILPNSVSTFNVKTSDGGQAGTTLHLLFTTSSVTGKFSGSATAWKELGASDTLTMNSNWTSKNFYYQDPTIGSYTITVRAKEAGWDPASITISVSDEVTDPPVDDSASTTATTTPQVSTVYGGGGSGSSHVSQSDLSTATIKSPNVGAGRKRLVTIGSPVDFEAWSENTNGVSGNYSWTFGDGSSLTGEKVSHAYSFAGTYNVVLNANFNGKEAVSRTEVEVFSPEVTINEVNPKLGFVELKNNSTFETNLTGWILNCDNNNFIFPKDTIVRSNEALKIPLTTTSCSTSSQAWSLSENGTILSQFNNLSKNTDNTERQKQISLIREKIQFVSRELEGMEESSSPVAIEGPKNLGSTSTSRETPVSQIANVIVLDKEPIPARKSFLYKLKSFFSR